MKNLLPFLTLLLTLISSTAFASIAFYNSSNVALGVSNGFKCGTGFTCVMGVDRKMTITPSGAGTTLTLSGLLTSGSISTGALSATSIGTGANGDATIGGNIIGDGGDAIKGFKREVVTATATTITTAQCGAVFINSGAVVINLPAAISSVGCQLTFMTASATNFDINPGNTDQIVLLTNALGDAIRNATIGNSVTLTCINSTQWVQEAIIGTWADVN